MPRQYYFLKSQLGRRPYRSEFYLRTETSVVKDTGWLPFLKLMNELTLEEKEWLGTPAEDFLRQIETTKMYKAYKLPVIKSFLTDTGEIRPMVSLEQVGQTFFDFYHDNPLHYKDLKDESLQGWETWDIKEFSKLALKNPINFLSKSSPFFHYDKVNQVFYLDGKLLKYLCPTFAEHVKDILEYRRIKFFKEHYQDEE